MGRRTRLPVTLDSPREMRDSEKTTAVMASAAVGSLSDLHHGGGGGATSLKQTPQRSTFPDAIRLNGRMLNGGELLSQDTPRSKSHITLNTFHNI